MFSLVYNFFLLDKQFYIVTILNNPLFSFLIKFEMFKIFNHSRSCIIQIKLKIIKLSKKEFFFIERKLI